MADDSKFVLRWEIDNAKAKFATGRVESKVFDKEGFGWTMSLEKDTNCDDGVVFALKCDAGHNEAWKCETEVEIRQYKNSRSELTVLVIERSFNFSANNGIWIHKGCYWSYRTNSDYLINDKNVYEIHINITSSEKSEIIADLIADPSMFSAPNRMSNVILIIGDERLHVSKEYLSVQSPVFETLFFGEFAENGKEEVEIKDVVYEEFIDLLHLIYLGTMNITDRTVLHILKLSDRFQMERLLDQAKMYLNRSNKFDVMAKLLIADEYNLVDLKNNCLMKFDDAREMFHKMQASPEYDKFSENMKAAICDRMMKLKLQ